MELTLGEVAQAVADAEQSVTYADRSDDAYFGVTMRTAHADALHQAGCKDEADARFREAETIQAETQPQYPQLYAIMGFRYCDLLLAAPELASWRAILAKGASLGVPHPEAQQDRSATQELVLSFSVEQRSAQSLSWGDIAYRQDLINFALDRLTLSRAALYAVILAGGSSVPPLNQDDNQRRHAAVAVDAAVDGLRRANHSDYLPLGLLSRAWLRFLNGARTGPESAQTDLDEAWEVAERGPMRLFMADIHLYRARLFHAMKPYPWNKNPDGTERGAKDDLVAARKLIEQCGYWRRKEELEDAEEAAKNWD